MRRASVLAAFGFAIEQAVSMPIYLAAFTKLPELLSKSANLGHPLLFAWTPGAFGTLSVSWPFAVTISTLGVPGPNSAPAVALLGLGLDISVLDLGADILPGNGITQIACQLGIGIDPDAALANIKLRCRQPALIRETWQFRHLPWGSVS
jgi:hypothetical protein